MKKIRKFSALLLAVVICVSALCFTAFADKTVYCDLIDNAKLFDSTDTADITGTMKTAASKTGFNIIVMTSDNVGDSKSDSAVVDMCDVLYEKKCGMNTDGVLFLINLDTRYHYISTSGSAINYLSDRRIDAIYDYITYDMRAGNYKAVALEFLEKVQYYYDLGKDNDQQEVLGMEVDMYDFWGEFIRTGLIAGFIAIIVGLVIFASISSQMKLQKPSARSYILKNSLNFTVKQDNYLGTFTNRVYSPRSSSSGSSSHHSSGHSSTHHSSSGGRHGGGGRHI